MEKLATADAILRRKGRQVYWVSPDTTVFEALKVMREKNVGALLVMEDDRLVGIFSERDYARKVAIEGRDSRVTPVRDITTKPVHTITPQTPISECMEMMSKYRVRHLPVLEDDRVVGVISVGDVVQWIIEAQSATIDQLQSYITGAYPG
ncbi:MAG: CBS domain-containing protein [Verrucomicrobia bacterium]|nr:MAG: CBS domain-containing protein [Verrucomicrobiota bacterium]